MATKQAKSVRHWQSTDFGPYRGCAITLDEHRNGRNGREWRLYVLDGTHRPTIVFHDNRDALIAFEAEVRAKQPIHERQQ